MLSEPLFHGASRDFDTVLPNNVHRQGRTNKVTASEGRSEETLARDEHLRETKAYATPIEGYAWKRFAHQTADLGGSRGRVYRVTPQPDQQPGAFGGEVVADKFPVEEQLDIKPEQQGTLPLDWRPFMRTQDEATPEMRRRLMDRPWTARGQPTDEWANHPTDQMIASAYNEEESRAQAEAEIKQVEDIRNRHFNGPSGIRGQQELFDPGSLSSGRGSRLSRVRRRFRAN